MLKEIIANYIDFHKMKYIKKNYNGDIINMIIKDLKSERGIWASNILLEAISEAFQITIKIRFPNEEEEIIFNSTNSLEKIELGLINKINFVPIETIKGYLIIIFMIFLIFF